ncbi:hypothetical protein HDU76_003673, partial [Blyttiomyces sp. JEL0837]
MIDHHYYQERERGEEGEGEGGGGTNFDEPIMKTKAAILGLGDILDRSTTLEMVEEGVQEYSNYTLTTTATTTSTTVKKVQGQDGQEQQGERIFATTIFRKEKLGGVEHVLSSSTAVLDISDNDGDDEDVIAVVQDVIDGDG